MYHITERNERRNRTIALWLAVGLHLGLGAALYISSSEQPTTTAIHTPAKKTLPAANMP